VERVTTATAIETGRGMNGKGMEHCLADLYSFAVHSLAFACGTV
jgi:hypothetical protein